MNQHEACLKRKWIEQGTLDGQPQHDPKTGETSDWPMQNQWIDNGCNQEHDP